MNLANDTYAIIKYKGKPKLAFVLNAKSRQAVLDETLHSDEPVNFTYDKDQVLASLGESPAPGSIYGIKVEPYQKTVETTAYGPIHFFRKLDKKQSTALRKSLKKVYSLFDKKASIDFLPLHGIHVRNKRGKWAGSYKAQTKGSERKDIITFHTEDFTDLNFTEYLIAHEFAHGIWYRCMPYKLRARWIKLYDKRMKLSQIDQDYLVDMLEALISYEGGLGAYLKEVADDDERLILKEVLNYFKKHHSLTRDNVELLIEYDSDTLANIWPPLALLTEKRSDVSQYASTKVEEFFAESIAYHLTGKILPKDVTKAVVGTLKQI